MSDPKVKSVLGGVENKLGSEPTAKKPLFFGHLCSMYPHVDFNDHSVYLTWIASILMFRCLLRVGQVVKSPHTLSRSSVTFTDYGFMLSIYSSKTKTRDSTPDLIPVYAIAGSRACIVFQLKRLYSRHPMPLDSPLFSTPRLTSLSYTSYSRNLRNLLSKAGIVGNFSSHSFRRGGATCMSELGFSLSDIKKRGRWKSACVNRYITHSLSHVIRKDSRWAELLSY